MEGSGRMKQKRERRRSDTPEKPEASIGQFQADKTDPQGSYTGRPVNLQEEPVQDADDL